MTFWNETVITIRRGGEGSRSDYAQGNAAKPFARVGVQNDYCKKVNDITCKGLGVVGEACAHKLARNSGNGAKQILKSINKFLNGN